MEIWKIIDDYPEYEVSTCCNGNIKYVKNYIFKFH